MTSEPPRTGVRASATPALLADAFEQHRPYLRGVAYRMLGSLTETDDALQEAWLRLARRPPADLRDLRPWLTTVVGRICLDALRARRARREEPAGVRLPEPIVVVDRSPEARPAEEVALADSVGLALLVVLETLSPAERLAFVLHDVFGLSFEEVATVVDRTPAAARQLASRARRRIRSARPQPDADVEVQRRVVGAFLAASREGRFEDLLELLDPEVVLRVDFGGRGPYGREPIAGRTAVLDAFRATARAYAPYGRRATVNGAPGIATVRDGRLVAAVAMTLVGGRIREIDIVADPAKLQQRDAEASRRGGRAEASRRGPRPTPRRRCRPRFRPQRNPGP